MYVEILSHSALGNLFAVTERSNGKTVLGSNVFAQVPRDLFPAGVIEASKR